MTASAPRLAIVVPCYNEEAVLDQTLDALSGVLEGLKADDKIAADSTLCMIDDGSEDRTWHLIEQRASVDGAVTGIRLSRNHGHQRALLAGLLSVDGDIVVSIDADLQDDINVIVAMVDAFHDGYDVVYGVREQRSSDSFLKRFTAQAFYSLMVRMGVELIYNHADFRLLSRRAIAALQEFSEVNLFLRGVIPSIGFPSKVITYERTARAAGDSKYPLRRMMSLAIDGVTSFSSVPLRLIALTGVLISFFSISLSVWVLWVRLTNDAAVPGWASSVLPIYLLGGIQLLGIGIVGEYISKIYLETKRRPRFIIQSLVGMETNNLADAHRTSTRQRNESAG